MPHVEIKCYEGRTDEVKRECVERVAEAVSKTLGVNLSSVSVAIKDYPASDWKKEVWDKNIIPDEKYLYKKPQYTCE